MRAGISLVFGAGKAQHLWLCIQIHGALTLLQPWHPQVDERSVYAAPFPYTATLDDLTAFFAARAPVNCVRQRRHLTSKDFKGSCFVEFASVDAATQARARLRLL